jgi:hypothetical protein
MKRIILLLLMISAFFYVQAQKSTSLLIEAESFANKGGWVVDPQFAEQMGSPYLLAHGMGIRVAEANTTIAVKETGKYFVWVRTRNWAPGNWEAPGRFYVSIDGFRLENVLGDQPQPDWIWEYAGSIKLTNGDYELSLHDLTGFEGRCDAIYLSTTEKEKLPVAKDELKKWRSQKLGISTIPDKVKKYDLVVVGGGIAGCAASIAAAQKGLTVALIQDRPVLGGVASGEIRVRTLGDYGKYEKLLQGLVNNDYFPNGSDLFLNDDQRRHQSVAKYKNIEVFLNYRAFNANTENQKIKSVDASHTSSGEMIRFEAPLFVDCTGDAWIGYWAGAEYMYGREASTKYNEGWDKYGPLWSPPVADSVTLGSSIMWSSKNAGKPVGFPKVPWAMEQVKDNADFSGEWFWEFTKPDINQIDDGEFIRDHLLKAIYGSFYNYKQLHKDDSLQLSWVPYVSGKRESRRLVGDYIFNFNDVMKSTEFEDAVACESRHVDIHYQQNLVDTSKPDFLSEVMFYVRKRESEIPYRSLYSKNITNLFMAGRNFSCSHLGLGSARQMRTTGQMGAAVGKAASLCKKYNVNPRDIYTSHLKEYIDMINKDAH